MNPGIESGGRVIADATARLPTFLTSFIGRASDIGGVQSVLKRYRLVTIAGPGGAGKTRLAAEVARSSVDLWPDGIWWVELVSVSDHAQMPWAVVKAMELPGLESPVEVASAWLTSRQALLILDNCEHLIDACASFCEALLPRCERLTILATSREVLGVSGEAQWPMSSLTTADAGQLFEARAQLALPSFRLTEADQHSVAEICEHLDRLPLAIELAAARVGMMSLKEILGQLSDRFRLLRGGPRSAHPKLQTMTAAIDWSYQLLSQDEAKLFRRLSVFRGGFTLESAQAVCADAEDNVLEPLSGLVQKSMVTAEQSRGSAGRYRLLESQLLYAEDRKALIGELDSMRQRHYDFLRHHLASMVWPRHPWISSEAANIWAALTWARNNADDHGLGLAAYLPYDALGDLTKLRNLLEELLRESNGEASLRMLAFDCASACAYKQGDFAAAIRLAEEGLAEARELGDIEGEAQLVHWMGCASEGAGDLDRASRLFAEALSLLKASANHRLINRIKGAKADLLVQTGDHESAQKLLAECVATARTDGDRNRVAMSLESLAWAHRARGDHRAAASCWRESLSITRSFMPSLLVIDDLEGLSLAAEGMKDDQRALVLAGAATRMEREMSYRVDPWWRQQIDKSHERARSRLARVAAEEAWHRGASMTWPEAVEYALAVGESESAEERGPLSRRELEVARLVANALSNREIAKRLFIEPRTVEGHLEHIRNKLGFHSRVEIANWYREQNQPHPSRPRE